MCNCANPTSKCQWGFFVVFGLLFLAFYALEKIDPDTYSIVLNSLTQAAGVFTTISGALKVWPDFRGIVTGQPLSEKAFWGSNAGQGAALVAVGLAASIAHAHFSINLLSHH